MLKVFFTQALEMATHNLLTMDPNHIHFLKKHHGKVLKITLLDIHQTFYLVIHSQRIYINSFFNDPADTNVTGTTFAFINQAIGHDAMANLQIDGDIDLAQDLQKLIKQFDCNWREFFAFCFGDVAAYKMATVGSQLTNTVHQISSRTLDDLLDYIHEEKRFLPTQEEVEDFYEEVANLRLAIDRLEARLERQKDNDK